MLITNNVTAITENMVLDTEKGTRKTWRPIMRGPIKARGPVERTGIKMRGPTSKWGSGMNTWEARTGVWESNTNHPHNNQSTDAETSSLRVTSLKTPVLFFKTGNYIYIYIFFFLAIHLFFPNFPQIPHNTRFCHFPDFRGSPVPTARNIMKNDTIHK